MVDTYGMTTTNIVGSMSVQSLPMSNALPITVNESTPNLAEIQSFPVIVSGGGIHIHQDPVTGQLYRMTDEFHSRIPQILAGNSSVIGMTGGVMPVSMPYVTTEYSLQSQFEDPIIFTDSNSLVSQLRNHIIPLSKKEEESIEIQKINSIQNEYISLYPDYNKSLKEFEFKTYFDSKSTQYSSKSILNKNRYSYPNLSFTRTYLSNIQTSISYINRYSYPTVK